MWPHTTQRLASPPPEGLVGEAGVSCRKRHQEVQVKPAQCGAGSTTARGKLLSNEVFLTKLKASASFSQHASLRVDSNRVCEVKSVLISSSLRELSDRNGSPSSMAQSGLREPDVSSSSRNRSQSLLSPPTPLSLFKVQARFPGYLSAGIPFPHSPCRESTEVCKSVGAREGGLGVQRCAEALKLERAAINHNRWHGILMRAGGGAGEGCQSRVFSPQLGT